jgi:voltage-gated potassium channel
MKRKTHVASVRIRPNHASARGTPLAPRRVVAEHTTLRQARFDRFVAATELPIALLALLIAPALIVEGHTTTPLVRDVARGVNWVVWLAFSLEYVGKVSLAPDRRGYIRAAWLDALIVVLATPVPITGLVEGMPVRLIGLVRFVRGAAVAAVGLRMRIHFLRPRRLHYAAVTTAVVVSLGALGIFAVEHGANPRIQTFGDAMWWSVVTATTVGYGDVSPVTPEGRLIAVGLMFLGIAFIGFFTATVSSVFFDQGRVNQVEERLARIEAKLDTLAAVHTHRH